MEKDKFQLEEKIKILEFKIPSLNVSDKSLDIKINVDKKFSEFKFQNFDSMMGIKNFTNFGIQNPKGSELEFYKKKCFLLEENLKELNQRLNNNNRITNHSFNPEINSIVLNGKYSESRKRTLTPIYK